MEIGRKTRVDESAAAEPPRAAYRWYQKLGAIVFIFFCLEIGSFLVLFPWMDLWEANYFSSLSPGWTAIWNNPYLRGAISGIGLVDIAIGISELFRLRRFWTPE